jgi:hypothetical protein
MDNMKKINKSSFFISKSYTEPIYFLELKFIRKTATNSLDLELTTVIQIVKINNTISKRIIERARENSFFLL